MALALDVHVDDALKKMPSTPYTVSGRNATLGSATVSPQRLHEIIRIAEVNKHEVALVAGVLTIRPQV